MRKWPGSGEVGEESVDGEEEEEEEADEEATP
jgi:hypothetical protein